MARALRQEAAEPPVQRQEGRSDRLALNSENIALALVVKQSAAMM